MVEIKSFNISKWTVYKAYKNVKANKGTYGIDEQSMEEFERDLKKQSVQTLEQNVVRNVLSETSKSGSNTKEKWRNSSVGNPNDRGQNSSNYSEAIL